jgi:SWIM zinc finger
MAGELCVEKLLDEDADRAFLRIVSRRQDGRLVDRTYELLPLFDRGRLLGWRLFSPRATHDLELLPGGLRCDCPDWDFRAEYTGRPCKHVRALRLAAIA